MFSPNGNKIGGTSSPKPSPAVQETPFFSFVNNLSPLKTAKAVRYPLRFLPSAAPSPPPVFTSPRVDSLREPSFIKRFQKNEDAGSDAYGQYDNTSLDMNLIPCHENEVQSSSPSGFVVDEYLIDPMEVGDCINFDQTPIKQPNDGPRALQSGFSGKKEFTKKYNDGNDDKGGGIKSSLGLKSLEQAGENPPGKPLERGEIANEQRNAASGAKNSQQIEAQMNIAGGKQDERCTISRPFSKSLLNAEASDGSLKPVLQGSVEDANQHFRGIRRHLQFDPAAKGKSVMSCSTPSYHHSTNKTANSVLASNLRSFQSLASDKILTGYEITCASEGTSSIGRSTQIDLCSNISAPMQSGFGLHLNSIVKTASTSDVDGSMKLADYISAHEKSGSPIFVRDSIRRLSVAKEISSRPNDNNQGGQTSVVAASAILRRTNDMNPPNASQSIKVNEQYISPKTDSENADGTKELSQLSPKRRRRRAASTSDSEACKHCNCKRSKCLKLYCECFSAGIYCADSCACENCFNKPEYEDTVLDTRQQIESRNPLAFAPKIVNHCSDSPANIVDNGNRATPSSARHKRGCNCKKSMCLKKYCECYQAKVGCSDGCRCEGCKNSFGAKAEITFRGAAKWEGPSHAKLNAVDMGTPSLDNFQPRFPRRSHHSTSESVSCDQELDNSKVGGLDQFSPLWQDLSDISHLTPFSHTHLGAMASLASPNLVNCPKDLQVKMHQGMSSQSSASSLHWNSSSINLVPQPYGRKAPDKITSDTALYDLVNDDNILEMLKENYSPNKTVKASSPNQKRVSPLNFRLQEMGSSSSPGLRSGRKLIWQTVPSFPPLSPYSNPKDCGSQYGSDSKGISSDQR